jgi:hypothetical protein
LPKGFCAIKARAHLDLKLNFAAGQGTRPQKSTFALFNARSFGEFKGMIDLSGGNAIRHLIAFGAVVC